VIRKGSDYTVARCSDSFLHVPSLTDFTIYHATTLKADGGVELQTFDQTPAGMVSSFVARFPAEDPELMALYTAEKVAVSD